MEKEYIEIIEKLKALKNEENRIGMGRFGINIDNALGVSVSTLRQIAKNYKKNQELAEQLWKNGIHEARMMASLLGDSKIIKPETMDLWVSEFNSWDICDQCCSNLFRKTTFAYKKAYEWAESEKEFTRRAGFSLMATLAVGDKKSSNSDFIPMLNIIEKHSNDSRNMVKKAVNWALRQIGKRNKTLYIEAFSLSEKLKNSDNKIARWIGSDAFREFSDEKIIRRIKKDSN